MVLNGIVSSAVEKYNGADRHWYTNHESEGMKRSRLLAQMIDFACKTEVKSMSIEDSGLGWRLLAGYLQKPVTSTASCKYGVK